MVDWRADKERMAMGIVTLAYSLLLSLAFPLAPQTRDAPSRPAEKGCVWEKAADPKVGLEAWVQRCDFGSRKIDFVFVGRSLAIRYSDGGKPDPLVDVEPLQPGETAAAGVKRVFASHTDKALAARCVLAPYREAKAPAGTTLYTFVPNAAYAKNVKAKANPNEVGEPPCGDWGDAPDGIQYFQVWTSAAVRAILFVRVGQDTPLFDEQTLRVTAR